MERGTPKDIIHILVYFRIYGIILKMSTSAHKKKSMVPIKFYIES